MSEPVDDGRTQPAAPERVVRHAAGIYRWRGRSMGRTIFGTYQGSLLLTSHRLVFLSSGGTDAWRKVAWASLGLGPAPLSDAVTVADAVMTVTDAIARWFTTAEGADASRIGPVDLRTDGSLSVPLSALDGYGVVQRRLSSFLWIACPGQDGTRREYAFSDKTVIPGGAAWAADVDAARAALSS